MVLTSWERARTTEGKEAPEFNSLSYHGKIQTVDGKTNLTELKVGGPASKNEDGEEWSVKVFSDHYLEDSWLRKAFGRFGWVYRKEVGYFVLIYCDRDEVLMLNSCWIVGCVPCPPTYRDFPAREACQGIVLC